MKIRTALQNMTGYLRGKSLVLLLLVVVVCGTLFSAVQPARAQMPVSDFPALVWEKVSSWTETLWRKAGSIAFNRTLTTALNKIAYDTATWIGSGHRGQKPLFVTNPEMYFSNIGDEAAGQFLESFVNNLNREDPQDCNASRQSCEAACIKGAKESATPGCLDECNKALTACVSNNASTINATPSFNVCQPSSLAAKVKIGLGLVEQSRPQGPNCTMSEIIRNWSVDSMARAAGISGTGLTGAEYLRHFQDFFDPHANDLGIYVSARTDLMNQQGEKQEIEKNLFISNRGWLDVRNISGDLKGAPNAAERELESARRAQETNIGTITGDALIDAANVFINQYAISAFSELMRSIADKGRSSSGGQASIRNPFVDPSSYYGVSALNNSTIKLLQPNFGIRTDYDILASLVVCPDRSNPGPDNCVIDDQFMQAISEKKTVAEALAGNYLHGDWQLTDENLPSTYNLRNISILRKYRIVPARWEEAVRKMVAGNKKATLNDLVSCFSSTDQYTSFSKDFDTSDQNWCAGLIDPNWVLKAPLNYCRQEGVGAQILNKTIIPGSAPDSGSQLSIIRADDYCADNQTCIKEKADGSCEAYGYCNEEQRTWAFNTDICQPINNTCQSFLSPAGQQVAYLQNTLDYQNCDAGSAGCRQYALNGEYDSNNKRVAWNPGTSLYFDKDLAACNSSDEGCTALLRVRPTWGSNLVMNSDFINDEIGDVSEGSRLNDWTFSNSQGEIVDVFDELGGRSGKAIKITTGGTTGGLYSDSNASLLPRNLEIIPGQAYTLSADIYLASGTDARLIMGSSLDSSYSEISAVKGRWQRLSITRSADSSYIEPSFGIFATGSGAVMYVMNIKFEMGNWNTGYSSYGSFKVQEKIIPNYLETSCYVDSANGDYRLKNDAPSACAMFARKCNKSEVGCESYLSTADKFRLSAQVTSADYCFAQCLGYNEYIAKGSYFYAPSSDKIIPGNAKICAASSVGCAEFTNLDEVSRGGEGKEYYSSLKQCIKPSTSSCSTFYSWEGSGSGYQLKSYSLKKDSLGLPAVTSDDSALCNATIYRLPVSDPGYNPDCREFYNAAGRVAYHLVSRTITCSENCHPYRMTEKNIDRNLVFNQCVGPDKGWSDGACHVCQNGGTWDSGNKACIYQAIPGEGQSCKAAEKGCREYNGSRGANIKLLFAHDYEEDLNGWNSNCTGGVTHSTVANNNNGHSLQYNNNVSCEANISLEGTRIIERLLAGDSLFAQLKVSGYVSRGSAYTIRFIARSASDTALQIFFLNPETGERSYFNGAAPLEIKGGNEWSVYQVNLDALNHAVGADEALVVTANKNFNLDDFTLSEITDRYYLIKGSSIVPDICSYDILDQYRGDEYNLGCSEYTDRAGQKHYLHRFSGLCSDSAVGCEQMINTHNYTPYQAGYWQDGQPVDSCSPNDNSCLVIPSDSAIYAVYDSAKLCSAGNQGCSRLGEGRGGANISGWADVYKKNNPDQYGSILCGADNLGCEEWRNSKNGESSYFKNPGTAACVYRSPKNIPNANKSWFRVDVRRCDLNSDGVISGNAEIPGNECVSDNDCSSGIKCVADLNDEPCDVGYDQTLGFGGLGNRVPVPSRQAGLCEAASSSCTEYLDPQSRAAANIVANPGYKNSDGITEGWGSRSASGWSGGTASANQQFIRITPNKVYNLIYKSSGSQAAQGAVKLEFISDVKTLQADNRLSSGVRSLVIDAEDEPIIFNALNNSFALVTGGATDKIIEVKEVIINYQLADEIDKTSCNGLLDFNNGCVLFNERSVNGSNGLTALGWDSFLTRDGAAPQACSPGSNNCTANQLIKVRPDRVCSKWLDCISFIEDPYTKKKTCYAFAECDRLDDRGECANYISSDEPSSPSVGINSNSSGYTPANKYSISDMRVVGKGFDGITGDFDSDDACNNDYCFISGPDVAKSRSTADYPADGTGYLKVFHGKEYPLAENLSIRVAEGDVFYINYLLSTKGSAGSGIIRIKGENGEVIWTSEEDKSPTGWQRKVNQFNFDFIGIKNISIGLLAKDGPVYFDDVAIEPVLKIADNEYSVSECRLYPTNDSLGCTSKNSNVIADGLRGYCIEKDRANPGVCLMWYPMDNVPLPIFSSKGYDGNFPLNYCTRTNGNFDFMEYRRGYLKQEIQSDEITLGTCGGSLGGEGYLCKKDFNSSCGICEDGYHLWVSKKWCDGNCGFDNYFKIICVPDPAKLKDRQGVSMVDKQNNNSSNSANGGNWEICATELFSTGYAPFDRFHGYEGSLINGYPDPNLMIRDYSRIASGYTNLKYIPGTIEKDNPEDYYHFTCDQVTQVVSGAGLNAMWADRVRNGSTFSLSSAIGSTLQPAISQSYKNPPFGGLVGDFTNQPVVSLADISTGPLAGLPYGCLNGIASNCNKIGYCSLATSTLCLIDGDGVLGNKTCGDNGTCLALFRSEAISSNPATVAAQVKSALKNISLLAQNSWDNTDSTYIPSTPSTLMTYNYTALGGLASIPTCSSSRKDGYCAIYPKISFVNLFISDRDESLPMNNGMYNIPEKGIYRLEFSSEVDIEQQPLKKIVIDWGDGYEQTITNQDDRPQADDPHVFYHYYGKTGPKTIDVRVYDNWHFCAGLQPGCQNR